MANNEIDKNRAKKFFICFGLFLWFVGIIGLFSKHNEIPSFHGRWGWLWEFVYNNFGPNGKYYLFILGGAYFFYYAIFKTKDINR